MRPHIRLRWRPLPIRTRTSLLPPRQLLPAAHWRRSYADDPNAKAKAEVDANIDKHLGRPEGDSIKDLAADEHAAAAAAEGDVAIGQGPNMEQLPHISEEAAAVSRAKGEDAGGPDIDQGVKASDVVKGDPEAEKNLPKVMREQLQRERERAAEAAKGQKRGFASSARARFAEPVPPREAQQGEVTLLPPADANLDPAAVGKSIPQLDRERLEAAQAAVPGLRFAPPSALPRGSHLRHRYDPVVDQVTNLLMRDGKKSVAQKHMATILTHLRTAPPPTPSPRHPLAPALTALPAHHLPLNPIAYLTAALDSVAPLFRIKAQRGVAGGGAVLNVPVPLGLRQRRRTAVVWLLDAAGKRSKGASGFGKRVAEEVVAVVEGRSGVWERRQAVHVLGVRGRSSLEMLEKAGGRFRSAKKGKKMG